MNSLLESFPPIASPDAKILILGSMPGRKSLEMNQYYAHPRNLFWPFMSQLFGFDPELDYAKRTSKLIDNNIALWDVLQHCQRKGSLDSDIQTDSMIPNDFAAFFQQHDEIKAVFFNGKKAEEVFTRQVLAEIKNDFPMLRFWGLPSTSPANASIKTEDKYTSWQLILEYCN